jgi:hypothetical protein
MSLSLLIGLCVLICPLVMIGMMVFMGRGMHARRGKPEENRERDAG